MNRTQISGQIMNLKLVEDICKTCPGKTNPDSDQVQNFDMHRNMLTLKQPAEEMNTLDEDFAEVWEIPKNAES